MTAQCLMLDVDGVLVNGHPEDGRSWAADIERDLGIDPRALQELFFTPHWADIVVGEKGLLEVLEGCLPALSSSLSAQDFIDYWFERDARVDEALLAACDQLRARGTRVYLATNQEHLRARYLMERVGLGPHVDGMVYSAAVAAKKPERAFFDAATSHSGAAPEQLVLVDDTEANVTAARQAGWLAHHWTKGDDLLTLMERQRAD